MNPEIKRSSLVSTGDSGWTEALQLMNPGAKFKLYIPPDIAYGPRDPARKSDRIRSDFEVELISFRDASTSIVPASVQHLITNTGLEPRWLSGCRGQREPVACRVVWITIGLTASDLSADDMGSLPTRTRGAKRSISHVSSHHEEISRFSPQRCESV